MPRLSRRDVLKLAGGAALAAALPAPSLAGILDQLLRSPPRLRPALTPNDEFYVTSYRSPPDIRVNQWSLSVRGLVGKPVTLTYPQLLERPAVSEIVTLECVGNGVAADAISTARWDGVPLKTLLEEAGVPLQAVDVVFHAADGYSDGIPVSRAMAGDVLVAHRMNGVPLPRGHGFPARIVVPGIYGMKNVQWVTDIEVVDRDYKGYYQQKGWSDEAVVKTSSHIDLPGHGGVVRGRDTVVRGYAFAGNRGIGQVEVSMDGGETWSTTELEPELAPAAWRFWSYRWTLPGPGRYALQVRATDGAGRLQITEEQAAFPDGAVGLHEITVTVQA
jgi:DMSO/TMAO reductase YedYZ molybdopterin-dependent catalytic subunit